MGKAVPADAIIAATSRAPSVLVVDDVSANRDLLEGHLFDLGYEVRQARDGVEALEMIEDREPDLILLDVDMPRLGGLEVCRRVKAHPARRLIPIVILTALQDRTTRLSGLDAGADDFLTKPFDAKELLVRTKVLLRERALNRRLEATENVLLSLARTVEARDRFTIHHAERVGLYCRALGRAMGAGDEDADVLYRGGILHDLGKLATPDAILLKPGPLTDDEFAVIQRHSVEGERILLPLRTSVQYLPIVRHHHEWVNGRGYPDRLVGNAIPSAARIAAIADAWDAMVTDRPYRAGLDEEEARRRLREGAGRQWDSGMVQTFVGLLDRGLRDDVLAAQQRAIV